MPKKTEIRLKDHLERIPAATRPLVESALRAIRAAAPDAEEVVYQSSPPRSPSFMWKLVRYRIAGADVVGVGTFTKYAALFFYRGRELSDPLGLLEGTGKDNRFTRLRSAVDAEDPGVARLLRDAFEQARGQR